MTRLRALPRAHLIAGICMVALLLYPAVNPWEPYPQGVLLVGFLLAIQASSWNIISGYGGYTSLGHSMFLGIGSYTAGILALRWGINPLWVAPLGGVVALLVALLIGSVVLRTRGHAFVIITIAMLLAAQILAINFKGLTQGSDGITLELPFWSRDFQNMPFYYVFLCLLVLTVLFSAWLRRTKFGAGLVAIREDEGKAASIGVNTTRFKIVAYAASAFPIGVAGGVYAYYLTYINPVGSFAILGSVTIVLATLTGGRGTLYGPVLGAFIVNLVSEAATVYGGGTQSRVLLFGAALMLVVLFLPKGILPTVEAWWRRRHPEEVEYTDQAGALSRGPMTTRERVRPEVVSAGVRDEAKAGAGDDKPLLDVRGVSKRFGGLTAVDGADLTVRPGTITALIGPNGSGKTTLFNLITGGMTADSGEIWFDGKRVDAMSPWKRGHLGLGRTYQVTRLFKDMTVQENVVAPLPDSRWRTMFAGAVHGHEAERARDLLDIVGLGRMAGQPAGSLSYGQQKLVELAQVLMLQPKLILLDEPAGGVNPSLLGRLTEVIRELNASGVTFLIVEHNIPLVLELCDPVVVFSHGAPIAEGPPARIREDPLVLDAYLGDDWRPAAADPPADHSPEAATGEAVR
ncbi:ABC transporter permease subunit [Actinomadura sp. HBU206391]|uniref:branched-chain amino acid ABC transporter ATP-binding protein/permease n=1 Tax=Actinomadura sp. HBU206391 TaxID=2731692 RepID=UPI001650C7A6|nr:branched-chain amino acid ABC transporter ATP-binding protein/permease [Actinomadura sp. HBU206391]MBC6461145.1 branched-chain amino acid ABC transporter ATP-binding protein/permease [Actinomadura sp. HBU206391]